jgi:hypothetical protein
VIRIGLQEKEQNRRKYFEKALIKLRAIGVRDHCNHIEFLACYAGSADATCRSGKIERVIKEG